MKRRLWVWLALAGVMALVAVYAVVDFDGKGLSFGDIAQ